MTNTRFLVEYEIKSHGILDGLEEFVICHPRNPSILHLKEKVVDLNEEYAILCAYLLFNEESMEKAHEKSNDLLSEFIDMLTFATSMDFQIHKKVQIIDWTVGVENRSCWVFQKFPGDERPYKVLNTALLETVQILLSLELPTPMRRALKWFSIGVSAKYMDEQFQCFWFVVEILAQVIKPTEKINDKCSTCGEPLFCQSCNVHPKHKPYAKQAIKHLFSKVVKGDSDKAFSICNDVRNSLLHGDDIESIEKETDTDFDKHVDGIGRTAWYTIQNMLRILLAQRGDQVSLHLVETSTFCEIMGHVRANISYQSENPDNPRFGEWPTYQFEANKGPAN